MSERNWENDLQQHLEERCAQWRRMAGQPFPAYGLRIKPPLDPDEAKYFSLGMEEGLFRIDQEGCAQSELFPAPGPESERQTACPIFAREPGATRLLRKNVCQLATASRLVLQRGWPCHQIRVNPTIEGTGGDIDILVTLPGNKMIAAVQVKRTGEELNKLSQDFRQCCRRGQHAKAECAFQQNHPSYEFCVVHQPVYFWAVAPGEEFCFRLMFNAGTIELDELESLPARSVIEF